MKNILVYMAMLLLCVACQEQYLFENVDSGPTSVKISFKSLNNQVQTRAVSSDEEEKIIHNAFLFIFNSNQSVAYKGFHSNIAAEPTIQLNGVESGAAKTFVVVANINNALFDLTSQDLDKITNRTELDNVVTSLRGNYIDRGTTFLMSGILQNITLFPDKPNLLSIPLVRLDSKFTFHIRTPNNVTFTPKHWRVVQMPKKVTVTNSRADQFLEADYFTSNWDNFDVVDNPSYDTFSFYNLENNVSPRKEIPNVGSLSEQYALREKEEKLAIPSTPGSVQNGAFEYAPLLGTYVEFTGHIQYLQQDPSDPTTERPLSADVNYRIHLGGVDGVNDYVNNRNTYYHYNVTINSVDQIIVEVDSQTGEEPRPGAEGDVVISGKIHELDAYNEVLSLKFHASDINDELTWSVSTPFSEGVAAPDVKDYKWIYFALNEKSAGAYSDNFHPYLGDKQIYDNVEVNFDQFKKQYNAGNDRLLNVSQLVGLMKESKKRYLQGKSGIFDKNKEIVVTAFVREFYYETNPNDASQTAVNGLWKDFTNAGRRVMNIFTDIDHSYDQESSKTVALHSIRQFAIQTMYNRRKDQGDSYSAWGSQMIQDANLYPFQKKDDTQNSTEYASRSNGRKNSITMWHQKNMEWTHFIDPKTWTMHSDYKAAKYMCLRQNRDMNGNKVIDDNEVQWYLASINQLTDIWIGQPSFDNRARLYQHLTWLNDKQWYASSTVPTRIQTSDGVWKDNPTILWSAEGSSIGPLKGASSGVNSTVYYRCVRNLGLSVSDDRRYEEPSDFAQYNASSRVMDLSRLDLKSLRNIPSIGDLGSHDLHDDRNRPWVAYEVANTSVGSNWTWKEVHDKASVTTEGRICPQGWHVPNQRELALLYSRIPSGDFWTLKNHFTRTGFNWGGASRPGFSISQKGETFFLINSLEGDRGGVRCVRDVIQNK